jgi:hypothetical protein
MGILKKYTYECPETWCETLPLAVYAYNSLIQNTIAISPFEIMFGRKAKSFEETFNSPSQEPQVSAYVAGLRQTMKTIHEKIVPRQVETRQKMAERYNSKAAGDCFKVGDQVQFYNITVKLGDSRKFNPFYNGPFIITEQNGVNCKITPIDNTKLKEQWVHQNRLSRSYSKFRKEVTPSLQQEETNNNSNFESSDEEIWITRQPSSMVHNVLTATPAVTATVTKVGPTPVLAAPQPAKVTTKTITYHTYHAYRTSQQNRNKTYHPQRKIFNYQEDRIHHDTDVLLRDFWTRYLKSTAQLSTLRSVNSIQLIYCSTTAYKRNSKKAMLIVTKINQILKETIVWRCDIAIPSNIKQTRT